MREALFTFVDKSKTDLPCVRSFVRSKVRKFESADFGDFYQKNMRGGHMLPSSEVLKRRFWRYLKKSGPPLCYQWQMRHTFGQVLDGFFALFSKKLKLHIPGAFAPLPCTVYLVITDIQKELETTTKSSWSTM